MNPGCCKHQTTGGCLTSVESFIWTGNHSVSSVCFLLITADTTRSHSFPTGRHRICIDQRSAEGVFQTAAVHHAGQQTDPQLPGEKRRRAE